MNRDAARTLTPEQLRQACRSGDWTGQTSGLADGYAQANLVVLPQADAAEFLQFCQSNPKPCPLLAVTEPGSPLLAELTEQPADLRTDLPSYRVWREGELVEEPTNVTDYWRDDLVSFLIGCSFSFESALHQAGIPLRHVELNRNVPMFRTSLECTPAGRFRANLVVSMRPLCPAAAIRAVEVTSRFPQVHGSPVHIGLPELIGIDDLQAPDFGDAVPVQDDELPVFWACGVTPQDALMQSKPEFAITHSPGCMFVTDRLDSSLEHGATAG